MPWPKGRPRTHRAERLTAEPPDGITIRGVELVRLCKALAIDPGAHVTPEVIAEHAECLRNSLRAAADMELRGMTRPAWP